MENKSNSTAMLPISGASNYYLAEIAAGEARVFSVRSKRFLARNRYGLRWRSQIRTDDGRARWIYLDQPVPRPGDPTKEELFAKGAKPLVGYPEYLILPNLDIYRVVPAKRGPSAGGITKVVTHYRCGSPYVQLPGSYGRRSTFSVNKLADKTFKTTQPTDYGDN